MMNALKRSVSNDGLGIGFSRLIIRTINRSLGKVNARIHGIDGHLPIGSQVSGLRYITVGQDFRVHGRVWIEAIGHYGGDSFEPTIRIGNGFRASDRLHITAIGNVTIGDNCLFGSSVFIGDHAHGSYGSILATDPRTPPASRQLANQGDVTIGANCWIGDNVCIVGPVTIGSGAVIAANSVVNSDVDAMTMVAGVPARAIKHYQTSSKSWIRSPN